MHRQGRSDTEIEIYYDDDDDDFFIYPIPTEVFWRHPFPYGEFFSCFAGLDVELWCESASTRKKKTDERAPGRRGGGGQAFGISLYATYSDEESQKSAHRRGGARSKQAGCSCFFFFFFFFFFFLSRLGLAQVKSTMFSVKTVMPKVMGSRHLSL